MAAIEAPAGETDDEQRKGDRVGVAPIEGVGH
jgi:hypothetical protein